jgi:hypothetical protein
MSDQATDILSRWQQMKTARMNWDVRWDECARYIMPRKGNILTKNTPGEQQTINLYDSTAEEAAGIFAAGMMTHIMPAGEKWFRFQPKPGSEASDELKTWLDQVTDIATDAIYSSNFYLTAHEDCLDAGVFGTSVYLCEEGKRNKLNFISIPVGTFAVEEDCEGMVDTVGREWQWTVRQAAQEWGKENLGKQQQEALNSADPNARNRTFTYVHFVEPRADSGYAGGPAIAPKRPIRSVFICVEDKQVIMESGYYSMPYFCSRLLRSNNEVYGRGPGIQVMPEIKLVNAMERDLLTWIELMGNPPWLAPDDLSGQIDNRPGGVTYWDSTNQNAKPEQLQLKGRVDLAEQKTEQKRNRIRMAFYNPLFQMLTNMEEQKREKTAYEVQQMVAEKLLLFSPLFARYVVEKLNPMLARVVDVLARSGMLPPPPEDANGAEYEITYVSKIALAIKAAENQSFATMVQLVNSVAEALDPAARNVVKWTEGVREIARNVGMPSRLLRSDREVQQLTAQQNEAAAAAQQAQTAELASRSVKNLGPKAQERAAEMAGA